MFSVRQKREISDAIQKILRETNHPELPTTEIEFNIHVWGAEAWSWADIANNGSVPNPSVNPHNELQDQKDRGLSELRSIASFMETISGLSAKMSGLTITLVSLLPRLTCWKRAKSSCG